MNFLSHYYFDKNNSNSLEVLGAVLPDLVKNAHKSWKIHPDKKPHLFAQHTYLPSILVGWKKHLEVDKYFHNSEFFFNHTHTIKELCKPALENSVIRPSFLAHIALELMLDSLLITENKIDPELFYSKLEQIDKKDIYHFLALNNINYNPEFITFFDNFLKAKYLLSYKDVPSIIYAINRICMRIWPQSLTEIEKLQLSSILIQYHSVLQKDFMPIFTYINSCIDKCS